MIDQLGQQLVEEVLDLVVGSRDMFTALDISKEVQRRLKEAKLYVHESHRHLSLKQHIHDQCNAELDATWQRTLISIDNVDVRPFLYFPSEKDPADYVTKYPVQDQNAGLTAGTVTQQFHVVGPATAAVKVPGTCVFNSADNLHVPRRIIRGMGLTPGDTLYAVVDAAGSVSLLKTLDPNQTSVRDVKVDARQDVRMKRGIISALGLNGASFTISEDNGKITIRVQTDDQGNPLPADVATN